MNHTNAIINDDKKAFETVYYEQYEKLYFFYLKKTKSTYLSEELAQETFIKLWNYRKTLSREIPISVQIFRIARTTFIDALRKKKLLITSLEDTSNSNILFEEPDYLSQKELTTHIHKSIEALPPVRKKVFKLSREEGLSHSQIAELLSISPKSVNNHITKAIKQLKKELLVSFALLVTHL